VPLSCYPNECEATRVPTARNEKKKGEREQQQRGRMHWVCALGKNPCEQSKSKSRLRKPRRNVVALRSNSLNLRFYLSNCVVRSDAGIHFDCRRASIPEERRIRSKQDTGSDGKP
jgi:hypothetical protein